MSDGYSSSPSSACSPVPSATSSSSQLILLVLESVLSEFLRLACSVHASGYENRYRMILIIAYFTF